MILELILLSAILFLGAALIVATDYMKSVIIISIISVLAASLYLVMYAPDVALTEAAVGACASSCILILGIRYLVPSKLPPLPSSVLSVILANAGIQEDIISSRSEVRIKYVPIRGIVGSWIPAFARMTERWDNRIALLIVGFLFFSILALLCYYSLELHQYGDASAILKDGASAYYIANIEKDIGIKSLVTAILASYRGMDTFCETLVVVTAGICVMFILKRDER